MTRTSALWPTDVAIAAAVETDTAMIALLSSFDGKPAIFSGRAPREAAYPRIVIADSSEDRRATFGRDGNSMTVTLHLWSAVVGRDQVLEIYRNLMRLLEGQILTVQGHQVYRGSIRLVTIIADPIEPLMHGVVEFSAWTGVVV